MKKTIRAVIDYFHYCPSICFKPREVIVGDYSSKKIVEILRSDGVCVLDKFLDDSTLKKCQKEVDKIFLPLTSTFRDKKDYNNLDFSQHPIFIELVLNEFVLAVIESYFSKNIYLAMSKIQRLEPTKPYEERAFRWHHDTKGKLVKAMWLLTDVPIQGQRMSYVAGSHRFRHPWTTYEETRFTDEDIPSFGTKIVECAGPAGSVVIFDVNGIHRGNRNLGPRRDVVFGAYTAGRYLEGNKFNSVDVQRLSRWQQNIIERSKPKWK